MGNRNVLAPDQSELEASIVVPSIKSPATGKAGGGASKRADAWKVALAMGAGIKITAPLAAKRKREIVAPRFTLNSQVGAGQSPFHSVGCNATAAGTKLREQVRQLMAKSPVNFNVAMSGETAVEHNAHGSVFRAAGGGAKTSRPFNTNLRGQSDCALLDEEVAGQGFESRIAAGRLFNNGRCE
jgi:hypothetical protein